MGMSWVQWTVIIVNNHYDRAILLLPITSNRMHFLGGQIYRFQITKFENLLQDEIFTLLALLTGRHRWPMDFPHKKLVMRKSFHVMTSSSLYDTSSMILGFIGSIENFICKSEYHQYMKWSILMTDYQTGISKWLTQCKAYKSRWTMSTLDNVVSEPLSEPMLTCCQFNTR